MQLKLSFYDWCVSILPSKKCQTSIIADLLGNESFLQRVQKVIVCDLWLAAFGPCEFVFQGLLLVIILRPKPDVNIPNIFYSFHPCIPWTSNFDEAKILKIQINFWDRKSAIKCRVLAELSFPHASYLVRDVRMADIRLASLVYLPCLR